MARIRSIHPGLASDELYMSMSMAAKAAWSLLWTECDDHGAFEWKPIVLKARIFPADNVDFSAILEEYERLGCVIRREIDGKTYGFVKNFCKYQRPKHASYRHPFPEEVALFVGFVVKAPPDGGEDGVNATEKPAQMEEEGGSSSRREEEKKENKRPPKAADECEFEIWYRVYPRREDRGHALKAYRTARKKTNAETLLEAAKIAAERFKTTERRFIPLPATWLNGERWADQLAPDKAQLREMGDAW